jgi:MFS transporter, DHA3 family, multidrug efflux protein
VDLIGGWFGTGADRGIALVFTAAGVIGLVVTFLAMRSYTYRVLAQNYPSSSQHYTTRLLDAELCEAAA